MTTFRLEINFTVGGESSMDILEAHVDDVADAFFAADGISDQAMSTDLAQRSVLFDATAQAESVGAALDVILGAIRSAIHAAHGFTGDFVTSEEILHHMNRAGEHDWAQGEILVDA